ncbi:hypothetical protein QU38_01890, partial [Staphylococcus aureus]
AQPGLGPHIGADPGLVGRSRAVLLAGGAVADDRWRAVRRIAGPPADQPGHIGRLEALEEAEDLRKRRRDPGRLVRRSDEAVSLAREITLRRRPRIGAEPRGSAPVELGIGIVAELVEIAGRAGLAQRVADIEVDRIRAGGPEELELERAVEA